MPGLFDAGIATIFAREQLEACIIIGQYRMVVMRSDWDEARKKAALRAIWVAAGFAGAAAVFVIMCVAIPIKLLGNDFEDSTAKVIEGISKVIAAICILQLSLKLPGWLGAYATEEADIKLGLTLREVRFNVAWNIWREIAELGVFLIPSFLSGDDVRAARHAHSCSCRKALMHPPPSCQCPNKFRHCHPTALFLPSAPRLPLQMAAIPISAVLGIAIGLAGGGGIYLANRRTKKKAVLTASMCFITAWLSVGLFSGGMHEFEEATEETGDVFVIHGDFWSHKQFPMALFKPFGYSDSPSALQFSMFWLWTTLACMLHFLKYTIATWPKKGDGQPQEIVLSNPMESR